jgi:putative ABC transport system permease protein
VIVTGISDTSVASSFGGSSVTFTSGQAFDATKDEDVALVGKALAEKNNLSVGSTFTAYGKPITVVGIYDTGNTFSNANLVMQLSALQRLSSQPGAVTSATVTVDSIDNVDATVTALQGSLGDKADITSNLETAKTAVAPLESVKSISTYSLIGSLVAGSIIILLTMVMIVRERRREIGVMKAIGSSNTKTMLQFMTEAVTLTFLSLVIGIVIGALAANPVTKVLVKNSETSNTQTVTAQGGATRINAGANGGGFRAIRTFGGSGVANLQNIQASVGTNILVYGVMSAFIIAIIGSAVPALLISKIRPADVMRAE